MMSEKEKDTQIRADRFISKPNEMEVHIPEATRKRIEKMKEESKNSKPIRIYLPDDKDIRYVKV